MTVYLTLPTYTLEEIRRTLLVTPDQNSCINVHVPHPTLPLLTKHLHTLQGMIRSRMDHTLSHTILFHHLHITAASPLIPRDRSLHLTLYNFTHTLIPPGAALDNTPHRLHLFLNPYNRFPYLQHTHTLNDQTTHCIEITTSMPSPTHTRWRPVNRTVTHTPNCITTFTFSADSPQHQLFIMTLTTHLLLSVPILLTRASWDIIQ